MKPWIVMRSHNDMPLVAETLAMLRRQTLAHRLLVCDNASTDGTAGEAARHAERVITVSAGAYVPGRVLNQAMAATDGECVAFLNSDCTPSDERWLERLLAGFDDDQGADDANVAAVFGRQAPRPGCRAIFARDTEAAYGDGGRQQARRHCFSMAAAAIRRSVWERMAFNEDLRYSEDIDWTWRARQAGLTVRYVADAVAAHSHNYTWRRFYRRHYGEGRAEAAIFDWSAWERSLLRYSLLPYARQVVGDAAWCLRRGELGEALRAPLLRLAQMLGRRAGLRAGWKERQP